MPAIDVVIVSHDHAPTLDATLAGVAAQRSVPNSVVVVDNASSDGSADVAERWRNRLPLDLVRWPENRGFAQALNAGIRRTDAPWILALNPDCRLDAGFLGDLGTAVAPRPRVGAGCGLLLRGSGTHLEPTDLVDSAGLVVSATGRHFDRGSGRCIEEGLLRPCHVFGATGAAALYRREALDDVAYCDGEVFDERFFAYREDADLAWRLQRRGWSCLYWPTARAWHGRGLKPEARRAGTEAINRMSVRNRFLLRWANADWRWYLACFPWWLLRDMLVCGACLTVERSSLPGLKDAMTLRSGQKARGRANSRRATGDPWSTVRWFMPWSAVREAGR